MLVGLLELALERTALVVGLGADAGGAQRQRRLEGGLTQLGQGVGHVHAARLVAGQVHARVLERQHDALEAHGKADARRVLAALELGQAVVATAAADGADARVGGVLHLKHGTHVVVQAAHQRRVLDVRNTGLVQVLLHLGVVGLAVVAEVVGHERRVLHDLAVAVDLAVKGAQRVEVGALAAVLAHLVGVVQDELADLLAVGGAARGVAHRVDAQGQALLGQAQALVELHQHDNRLGIGRGVLGAQPLDAHLVELTQAATLRALTAEHSLAVPDLGGSRALRHKVVLDGRAHDARRALRPHRHALLGLEPVLAAAGKHVLQQRTAEDAEHLLAHHVGRLADAVGKGRDLLDRRCLDRVEPVRAKKLARDVAHPLPAAHIAAVEVLGTLNPLCHTSPSRLPARRRRPRVG